MYGGFEYEKGINALGDVMPRKSKAFKSRRRDAQKEYAKGNTAKAHEIWQQIVVDQAKRKAEKKAK